MEIFMVLLTSSLAALGAFFGALLTSRIKRRVQLLDKKIDVYLNLITCYNNVIISSSDDKSRLLYKSAQEQAELIGNDEVVIISKQFYTEKPDRSPEIIQRLIQAMRKDLKSCQKF
jgi:hypothetical protein